MNDVLQNNEPKTITLLSGETVDMDVPTANVLLTILNALEPENKERMIELLSTNTEKFFKVVKFSFEQLKEE